MQVPFPSQPSREYGRDLEGLFIHHNPTLTTRLVARFSEDILKAVHQINVLLNSE